MTEETINRAQIAPDSTMHILRYIPLDNRYDNTIYFNNKSAQYNYFVSKRKYTYDRLSYIRKNGNTIKIEQTADNLLDCNYIMFQNSAYGNRWFYAFINEVNYINDVTAEIVFELDVMQTWFFDFSLEKCIVEREHVANDGYFKWILDEGLDTGGYSWGSKRESGNFTPLACAMITTGAIGSSDDSSQVSKINGVYIGGILNKFYEMNTFKSAIEEINNEGLMDSVVGAYMVPQPFLDKYKDGNSQNNGLDFSVPVYVGTFNGYTPKNKKLYCYPYNFLVVDAVERQNILRYEYFNIYGNQLEDLHFKEYCTILPNPVGMTIPQKYEGNEGDLVVDTSSATSISNFPLCGIANDTYKAWLAQNSQKDSFNEINSVLQTVGGIALAGSGAVLMASGVGAGIGTSMLGMGINSTLTGVNGYLERMRQHGDIQALPDRHYGSEASDISSMTGTRRFKYRNRHITYEYAQRIDDFFTMYGYKIMQLKVPNINVRPYWTYCKTIGCNIRGNIPVQDANKIKQIFDNGITHWRNGDNIGNYSLNNSPVSREQAEALQLDLSVDYMTDEEMKKERLQVQKIRIILEDEIQ